MRYTVYFLIEPNEAARREIGQRAGLHADLLLEPLLTSRDCGGRSAWREEDVELVVKLIYLARVREHTPFQADSDAQRVLGSQDISAEVFDRWWTIRRLHLEEGSSESMEDYLKSMIQNVKPTGVQIVDSWLEETKRGAV